MAYPEYTKCTTISAAWNQRKEGAAPWSHMFIAWIATSLANATVVVIIAAILSAAELAIVSGPIAIGVLIGALYGVVTYCNWWLERRLICMDGDNNHCAIGFVAEFEPPESRTGWEAFDNDFSMNIGVIGTYFGDFDLDAASKTKPFGYLLKSARNDDIVKKGFFHTGVNAPGDAKASPPYAGMDRMKALHVEFEGRGIVTLRDWVKGLIALLLLAEVLAALCAGGLVWACALLAVLLMLFLSLGHMGIQEALSDSANPGDIDKALGSLSVGDIVLVSGRWVYDAGHINEERGWNEIHPLRHCQIIKEGVFNGDWASVFPLRFDEWCKQVAAIGSTSMVAKQKEPQNGWQIHPLVDGCRPLSRD